MEARRGQATAHALTERASARLFGSWPALPASVSEARRAVVDYACRLAATPAALAAIELAVSEAMTNAVQHAYPGAPPGPVSIIGEVADSALVVTVADEGTGM